MSEPDARPTRMEFDLGALGRVISAEPYVVTPAAVDAYAQAVDAAPTNGVAPPLFSIVPCYPILFASVDAVSPDAVRERTVQGGHDVTVHRTVRPGDVLVAQGCAEAVRATSAGAVVSVRIDVTDGPELVAVHRLSAVVRGVLPATEARAPADRSGGAARPELDRVETVHFAADQPARYARATGDHNTIHVDRAVAVRAGFDGVIAHGLGVMGVVTSALTRCATDGEAPRRVAARFAAPVYPGQDLALRWGREGGAVAFEVTTADGKPVLRAGTAEVS